MDKQTRAPEAGKRTYTSPEFQMYGNLAHITATVGKVGSMDGGTGSMDSTR